MTTSLACTTCQPAHVLALLPVTTGGHLIERRVPLRYGCGDPQLEDEWGWSYAGANAITCVICLVSVLSPGEILDFEEAWGELRSSALKAASIRQRFALTPTRYNQALIQVLGLPESTRTHPELVQRLIRLAAERRARRSAAASAPTPRRIRGQKAWSI